jgi:hypothetical protein
MSTLVITNGDTAADLIVAAGHGTEVLSWRDVLHEGPIVRAPLGEATARRVAWLASRFGLDASEIAEDFAERDDTIRRHAEFERVELWFEHDLFDQLQLVQVLDTFASLGRTDGLVLVQADSFLGAERAETILRFADRARAITRDDFATGQAVWTDLASPTPEAITVRLDTVSAAFPYLRPALRRFLEELPAPGSGLSRAEQTALEGISAGTTTPGDLFAEMIGQEEAAFMGDWSFFHLLDDLATCEVPLITGLLPRGESYADSMRNSDLALTMAGDDVLAGEDDHVALSGLDRWWAGTHLHGRSVWRFDRGDHALLAPRGGDA